MKRIFLIVGMVMLIITTGCTNLSTKKAEQNPKPTQTEMENEDSAKTIEKENAVFNSVPVFELSAEDVYEKLSKSKGLTSSIAKNKMSSTFTGDNHYMVTTVYNHHDEKIDRFFIQISNFHFYNNKKQRNVVADNFKEIFNILNVQYDENKLFDILKTDVTKKRENKIDSYPEDIKIFPYDKIWIGVEGIYNTNNEPKPNQLQVSIFPTKPEGYSDGF
uniref:Lipoprotein n=1 Tax=Neobacillus novalis TaxID=220687 RepID=A0AA95S927_9BACI|nr:hypothetical protein [Neobacillus novalis]WHY86520.1 hypothetical protein QNH39_01075 [Neobacillus novalis]